MNKKVYNTPVITCWQVTLDRHLAAGSYLPYVTEADDGTKIVGYIYEEGHDGDPNFITDYIWEDDDEARGTNWEFWD